MGRRVIAIFAAAVVALIGVTSVLLYARSADARAVQANQPVDAYIAAKVVPAGTTLKDAVRTGLLEKTTAAAKGLPAGALTAGHRQQQLAAGHDRHPARRVRDVGPLRHDADRQQGDPGPARAWSPSRSS